MQTQRADSVVDSTRVARSQTRRSYRLGRLLTLLSALLLGCSDSSTSKPVNDSTSNSAAASNSESVSKSESASKPVVNDKATTERANTDVASVKNNETVKSDDGAAPSNPPLLLPDSTDPAQATAASNKEPPPTKLPADLLKDSKVTPLNPQGTVLLDVAGKRVLLKTNLCLRRGLLEMFLCLKQTKEHESVLSIDAEAYTIHGALLALGAKEGQPVKFEPEYTPPSGEKIEIFVHWVDAEGKLQRRPAQEWIRHSRDRFYDEKFEALPDDLKLDPDSNLRYDPTNKFLIWYGPMTEGERDSLLKLSTDKKYRDAILKFYEQGLPRETKADFVFVGSGFSEDAEMRRRYLAEEGFVICVANFTTAMIDVAVQSSATGTESLNFEAWQERLPPTKSEVLVELIVPQKPASVEDKKD